MNDNIQRSDAARHVHSELKKLYEEGSGMSVNEFDRKMKIIDVHVKLVSAWYGGAASK